MTKTFLRRYTELPFAIDFLRTRQLTLLNPVSWDDRNDSYYIEQYRLLLKLKGVYALCLADSPETYHHWRVFSHGSGGVSIEFDRDALIRHAHKVSGLRAEPVTYRTIKELRASPPDQAQLPFLKRSAFSAEGEFRLFYGSDIKTAEVFRLDMPLSSVARIILSPWLPDAVSDQVKKALKSIEGCSKLRIYRSTLVENENWKRLATGVKQIVAIKGSVPISEKT